MTEFVLHSNRCILPDGEREAFVWIKDGRIRDVSTTQPTTGIPLIEAGNKALMPGVIDPHVHINEPGRTEWEGFDTATKAALAGGVTTLVDMPLNASPVTTSAAAFDAKLKAARQGLHTDCGFWGGLVPGNEAEIEPMIDKGVLGFKAFLTHSGIDDFPAVTEADLRKAMPLLAKHGLPLLVHCELTDDGRWTTDDGRSYKAYLASRPKKWEDSAIALMIRLCEDYNGPVHIVHLSSADSVEQIRKAKEKGLPLTVETAQHYLYFCAEKIPDGATAFKCAPPVRERENRERLWQALADGTIDFVATDHSPCPPELKEVESGDFTKAWGGIASIQFALPVLWTAAKKRGFALPDVAKWLSQNPAKLIGQGTKKGRLAEGFDADLVLFDPDKKFTVTEEMTFHRHKLTPYAGRELVGAVAQTYLGGELVFDGKIVQTNRGRILLR